MTEVIEDIVEEAIECTDLAETNVTSVSTEIISFEKMTEIAKMLSKSTVIPVAYQNRPENCFVAIDMANRMALSPMVVMQNLHVIQGKPSWSGQAISSMIRNSSQFKNVELNYVGKENTDEWGAYITAERRSNNKIVKGATVTIATAKKEGWFSKTGSKWQTMPELMLAYRAYAWFGRVYAPELMLGLLSVEEVDDISTEERSETVKNPYEKVGV